MTALDRRAEPGFVIDRSDSTPSDYHESKSIHEMISKYFFNPEKDRLKESIIRRIQAIVDTWMVEINIQERKLSA